MRGESKVIEKKVVSRGTAIAFGIVCIVLVAGLAGAIVNYTSIISGKDETIQATIEERDRFQAWLDENKTVYEAQISSLNTQITNLQNQIDSLDSEIQAKEGQIEMLTNEKNQLQTWLDGNITALNAKITTLEVANANLETEYANLQAEYEALTSEYYELKAPKLSLLSLYSKDERPMIGTPHLHIYGEVWNVGTDTAYDCKLHVVAYQGDVKAIDTEILLGTIYGENKKAVDSNIYYSGDPLTMWSITPKWLD